ncbi:MAG TPA: chalcone isomerase family protein [Spirochaetota bacterium]|nr:chalcone isomerase family protein [Spirochaetota bacterium]
MKIKKFKSAIFIMILSVLLSVTSDLRSAEIDGVFFNDEYSAGNRKLYIRGYAILNYMLVIKAYAGALYMENGIPSSSVLGETPRILELYYYHKISAGDFRESTIEMIKRNTTDAEFSNISERLNRFNSFYRGVKPGDRYRAEYIPGRGTTLYLNGRALGTIPGNDFSKGFFSIWIGRDPIDKKFRDKLLGRR